MSGCFHSAGVNRSDQIRKTFVVGYSYRWMRPDDYNTQDEELLRSVNPLERELMEMKGMNISRDGAPLVSPTAFLSRVPNHEGAPAQGFGRPEATRRCWS